VFQVFDVAVDCVEHRDCFLPWIWWKKYAQPTEPHLSQAGVHNQIAAVEKAIKMRLIELWGKE
jgi:hypothetical protein